MKNIAKVTIIIMLSFLLLTACNAGNGEKVSWENIVLNNILPQPKSSSVEVSSNSNAYLCCDVYKTSENEYYEYIRRCKDEKGFTIDVKDNTTFFAYNEDGYKVSILYIDTDKYMNIKLYEPLSMEEYVLPDYAIASNLPQPKSKVGNYNWKYDDSFYLYVGNTSKKEYEIYKNKCIAAGFDQETNEGNDFYSGFDTLGNKIHIGYSGYNTMFVELSVTEEYLASLETESGVVNTNNNKQANNNKIKIPYSSFSCEGDEYKDVVANIKNLGFTNITVSPIYDLDTGTFAQAKINKVKAISIAGKTDFNIDDVFDKNDKVIIKYHLYEKDNPNIKYKSCTVAQLMNALDSNLLRAEETFDNQYVELSGRVESIDKQGDFALLPSDDAWEIRPVACNIITEELKKEVIKMSSDDNVIVYGKITYVGSIGYSMDVYRIDR